MRAMRRRSGPVWALMFAVLAAFACAGCGKSTKTAEPASSAKVCKSNKDCSPLPCGPCTPGTVITEQYAGLECVENPCKDAGAACDPDGVCVVK